MNRRGFLGSILALGAAPAFVRASSLMPLWTPKPIISVQEYFAAGEYLDANSGFEIREMKGYDIATGYTILRHDLCAGDRQWHVDSMIVDGNGLEKYREHARVLLKSEFINSGKYLADIRKLNLPVGLPGACHIPLNG